MDFPRSSGILLHPTSLPGRYGIGDLGPTAYRFVDWLHSAEQSVWQVLPLGPTGYADSPYQSPCTFAGNPNLISLDALVEDGFLSVEDVADVPGFPAHSVDYGPVIAYHRALLHTAYQGFVARGTDAQRAAFTTFCADNAAWLDDYALFAAVKDAHNLRPWTDWSDAALVRYQPDALAAAHSQYADAVAEKRFEQWLFFRQWAALRAYANERGVRLMGDVPIFVAHDSSDVWANQGQFFLDDAGHPTVIAGVPPDYFSATGQRWGNPLYRWDVMRADGYAWWIARLRAVFATVDMVRIDHFRGFQAYWEIPASEATAINGQWVKGPGHDVFQVVQQTLGKLPIVAEDLGVITPEVEALRDDFAFPGMKVLQFAFDGACGSNLFLPHHTPEAAVVYTGTHDNNTTYGWWHSDEAHDGIRECVYTYLGHDFGDSIHWALIRLGSSSVARTFVAPLQDVLGYAADARMNTPGTTAGNWAWRFTPDALSADATGRLRHITRLHSRHPGAEAERVTY